MTLAAILAAHTAQSATPFPGGVARCGAGSVGAQRVTPVTPATPQKTTPELRVKNPSDAVQPATPTGTLRTHLLMLAAAAQVDPHHVHRMLDSDLADHAGLSDEQLTACLHMIADTADRNAGLVPAGDTAVMHCIHCGPVYIHPDIAAVLPVVDGLPRGLGCPWCFVRKAGGTVPSPLVSRASAQPDPTKS